MDFKTSETAKNLMRAFAGESQARNRYTFCGRGSKKRGLVSVSQIFFFYGRIRSGLMQSDFYELLKEMAGETIEICGGYPVDKQDSTEELLYAAQHNEYEEADDVYQSFGDVAKEEGFYGSCIRFLSDCENREDSWRQIRKTGGTVKDRSIF